ncbi:unnamed protein product [Tenebrio molitor]|nr:unnamed protein product [Tenebrio molitor]
MYRTRRRSTTALENRRERCQEQHDPVRQEIGLSSRDSTTSRRGNHVPFHGISKPNTWESSWTEGCKFCTP